LLTSPQRKAYPFLKQKSPEEMRREAQHQAAFEAAMRHRRELHEADKVAGDAVVQKLLMESLGKPAPRKEREPRKEAEVFTCKFCNDKYTDARDSGGDGKKRTLGFAVRRAELRKRPHRSATTGARRADARTAARATASTGARRASARTAARATASTGARRSSARTAARATASTGARRASARTAVRATASTGVRRGSARTAIEPLTTDWVRHFLRL
jgi:hypothetical protein